MYFYVRLFAAAAAYTGPGASAGSEGVRSHCNQVTKIGAKIWRRMFKRVEAPPTRAYPSLEADYCRGTGGDTSKDSLRPQCFLPHFHYTQSPCHADGGQCTCLVCLGLGQQDSREYFRETSGPLSQSELKRLLHMAPERSQPHPLPTQPNNRRLHEPALLLPVEPPILTTRGRRARLQSRAENGSNDDRMVAAVAAMAARKPGKATASD
jgi:hypothetical protein